MADQDTSTQQLPLTTAQIESHIKTLSDERERHLADAEYCAGRIDELRAELKTARAADAAGAEVSLGGEASPGRDGSK